MLEIRHNTVLFVWKDPSDEGRKNLAIKLVTSANNRVKEKILASARSFHSRNEHEQNMRAKAYENKYRVKCKQLKRKGHFRRK